MPTAKVTIGAVVGAIVTVLIWVIKTIWSLEVPGEVGAALTTIFSFIAAYMTPNPND